MGTFVLPDCIMGIEIASDWGTFPLSSIVKQKACKFALQTILIAHAKREPGRLAEPTHCSIEAACWRKRTLCHSPV